MKSHLFAQEFLEKPDGADTFSLQNERLLKVRLTGDIMARQGAMVAYQGEATFAYQGAGAKKLIKKLVTGEDLQLMKVEGNGEVFLAKHAEEVHLVYLENDSITLNGHNVLAFESAIDWDIKKVKGLSGMLAQGLTNVVLSGTGWVALTAMGTPVVLNTKDAATYADPAAAIAWSSSLNTTFKKNDSMLKSMIGRGGGELFTMGFQGEGYVIVQPSEGYPMPAGYDSGGSGATGALTGLFNNS